MKKVNKKIKTPEGIAAVAAPLQKTSPIPILSGRETPPCFIEAMLTGVDTSDNHFLHSLILSQYSILSLPETNDQLKNLPASLNFALRNQALLNAQDCVTGDSLPLAQRSESPSLIKRRF